MMSVVSLSKSVRLNQSVHINQCPAELRGKNHD
jgi:hypothetical protein